MDVGSPDIACRCSDDDNGEPVCQPLKSLEEVQAWLPNEDELCVAKIPLVHKVIQEKRPKTLVCHDMAGGYLEDRFIQGCLKQDCYRFYHWQHIDSFVYFSHYFVTIPPPSWTNAAHRHGVSMLGTMITEWDDGKMRCETFLQSEDSYKALADQLVQIAVYYRFDGWLINIENVIQEDKVGNLCSFVGYLTRQLHKAIPNSLVLWYDSVINTGELKWQDHLNDKNSMFFDSCDGIFLNYCWNEEKLLNSKTAALNASRPYDVYVGIDIFGRGCPGGGGYNTIEALTLVRKFNLSTAIFAQGWVFETQGKEKFTENENKFWSLLRHLCYLRPFDSLPLTTSFCQGYGHEYYLYGKAVLDVPWSNQSIQQLQPILTTGTQSDCKTQLEEQSSTTETQSDNDIQTKTQSSITLVPIKGTVGTEVYIEDAFIGGTCLKLSADLSDQKTASSSLFLCEITIQPKSSILLTYTYKDTEENGCDLFIELGAELKGQPYSYLLAPPAFTNRQLEIERLIDGTKNEVKGRILVSPISTEEAAKHFKLIQGVTKETVSNGWKTRSFWLSEEILKDCTLKEVKIGLFSLSGEADKECNSKIVSAFLGQIQILPSEVFSSSMPKISNMTAKFGKEDDQCKHQMTKSSLPCADKQSETNLVAPNKEGTKEDLNSENSEQTQAGFLTLYWSCNEENLVDYYNVYQMTDIHGDSHQGRLIGHSMHMCFRVCDPKVLSSQTEFFKLNRTLKILIQPVLKTGFCTPLEKCTAFPIN